MDLFATMIEDIIKKEVQTYIASMSEKTVAEILTSRCYQALEKIKAILEDDTLEDSECFLQIEEIVCVFNEIGGSCGTRHDF